MKKLWISYCAWMNPWRAIVITAPFIIGIIIMAIEIIKDAL